MKAKKLLDKKEAATCHGTVFVDQFTDGILDPRKPMPGPVRVISWPTRRLGVGDR
jgi:hypothetical protein